jgi:hypothetical protein
MSRRALAAVIVVFLAWGAVGVARSSFTLGGERWFPLADDQMVSMRFAKNLAEGHGLTWNPPSASLGAGGGLRVEGFSNPLWTFAMAGLHLTGLPTPFLGLAVKLLALALLALNLAVVRRMAHELAPRAPVAVWGAVVLTAGASALLYWAVQGFEVALLVLLIDLALLGLVRWKGDARGLVAPSLWLGVATLVRLDAALTATVAVLFVFLTAREARLKKAAIPAAIVCAALALQTIARLAYYGDWLPNTYALKMTGYPTLLRVGTGLVWLGLAAWGPGLIVELPALGLAALRGGARQRLLVGLVVAQSAYSVWVGGDAWEELGVANRFVAVSLPAFAVLVGLLLAHLAARPPFARPWVAGLLIALSALALEGKGDPERTLAWAGADLPYKAAEYRELTALARAVADVTTPDASVAVVWAGLLPYLIDRPCLDLLGKSDRAVARGEAARFETAGPFFTWRNPTGDAWGHFYPGHLKWNYAWSVGEGKPDVIAQVWGDTSGLQPFLKDYQSVALGGDPRLTVGLRKGSPRVRWERAGLTR